MHRKITHREKELIELLKSTSVQNRNESECQQRKTLVKADTVPGGLYHLDGNKF